LEDQTQDLRDEVIRLIKCNKSQSKDWHLLAEWAHRLFKMRKCLEQRV